ncbi:MAG: hypothetical protein ACRCYU_05830 [Nocardioides sp.]
MKRRTVAQREIEHPARVRLDTAITGVLDGGGRVPCVARPGVFDPDSPEYDKAMAVRGCTRLCPVIAPCWSWVATGPDVTGIVAGRLHNPYPEHDPEPEPAVVWLQVKTRNKVVGLQAALDLDGLDLGGSHAVAGDAA